MKRKNLLIVLAIAGIICALVGFILSNQLQFPKESMRVFGIYLLENNDLVISDKNIISYNRTSHEIRLSEDGVEKITKMDLYQKPFVIKLDGKEIYNGSFWSDFSSIPFSGVVIIDILAVQSGVTGNIRIETGYPTSEFFEGADPRYNSEIFDYFHKVGKLTQ